MLSGPFHHNVGRPLLWIIMVETRVGSHANPRRQRPQRVRVDRRRAIEVHEPLWKQERQRNLVLRAGDGLHAVRWPWGRSMILACAAGTLTVMAETSFALPPTNSRHASTAASACRAI